MKFARHWVRVRVEEDGTPADTGIITAFGWSITSEADALTMAYQRALRIVRHFCFDVESDDGPRPLAEYYCTEERPMREPIVEELRSDGDLTAVITRNSYGCLVLNTATTTFIDIDLPPEQRPTQPGFFARLFGAKAVAGPSRDERESPSLRRIERVMALYPKIGMRLYRTRNGFRGLVTNRTFLPSDPAAIDLMKDLGSDPLYMRLCKVQECFRARLTPKPWRIGVAAAPKSFFPWRDDDDGPQHAKRSFEEWVATYAAAQAGWAVCEQVAHYGPRDVDSAVAPIFELHEQRACGVGPLA